MDNSSIIRSYNVDFEASIGLTSMSTLAFFLLCVQLIYYWRGDQQIEVFGYPGNLTILLLGVLTSMLTSLSAPLNDKHLYSTYIITVNITVGIVVTILGSCFLFSNVGPGDRPLGFHHRKMSLIIWVITIPLCLLGLFEGIATWNVDRYTALTYVLGLLQKIVQAGIYHFDLRHKLPSPQKKIAASWYLKIISFFNFVMWLDSIVFARNGNVYLEVMFGKGISMFIFALSALLIDYHLLCCLLFAEHAIEIDNPPTEPDNGNEPTNMHNGNRHPQMTGLGYLCGLICISLQCIFGLQYFHKLKPCANTLPMFADALVIVLGVILLKVAGKWKLVLIHTK